MSHGRPIVLEIRRRLTALCNSRERAYREAHKQGIIVPHLRLKTEAIDRLRRQLAASEQWSLEAHIKMVNGMADIIDAITPDFGSRFPGLRKSIADMVSWCSSQIHMTQAA